MSDIAFLFPGQGSQFVGMGMDFIRGLDNAAKRVEEANDTLGFNIGDLILNGPEEELKLTANTQPAILLISVIALEALLARVDIVPALVAGHSLGEFSACWAAGALEFGDAIKLVRKRGELMQSAVKPGEGAMAAVIGLTPSDVSAACEEAGGTAAPANFNSPEQTVIAGRAEDVARAMEILKARGAKKVVSLPVSAPFHTSLMEPAKTGLAEYMKSVRINEPEYPVLRNVDAELAKTSAEIRDGLIRQVTGCVRWTDSMGKLAGLGVKRALEIGPGKVLAGLMKRIDKNIAMSVVGTIEEADKAAEATNVQA